MICPKCKSEIADDSVFCMVCGEKIDTIVEQAAPMDESQQQLKQSQQETVRKTFDIGRSFTFVFKDKTWIVKCLILFAMIFVPLVGIFFVVGYVAEIARKSAIGKDDVLPEINFEKQLKSGFFFAVAFIGLFLLLTAIFIPFLPIPIIDSKILYPFPVIQEVMSKYLFIFSAYCLVFAIYLFSAVAYSFVQGNPWSVFHFGRLSLAIIKKIHYTALIFVLTYVLMFIGEIGGLCCIGAIITVPLSWMITGHLYGQFGRILSERIYGSTAVERLIDSNLRIDETRKGEVELDVTERKKRNTRVVVLLVAWTVVMVTALILFVIYEDKKLMASPDFVIIKKHIIYRNDVEKRLGKIERIKLVGFELKSYGPSRNRRMKVIDNNVVCQNTWHISLKGSKNNGTLDVKENRDKFRIIFEEVVLTVDEKEQKLKVDGVKIKEYNLIKKKMEEQKKQKK